MTSWPLLPFQPLPVRCLLDLSWRPTWVLFDLRLWLVFPFLLAFLWLTRSTLLWLIRVIWLRCFSSLAILSRRCSPFLFWGLWVLSMLDSLCFFKVGIQISLGGFRFEVVWRLHRFHPPHFVEILLRWWAHQSFSFLACRLGLGWRLIFLLWNLTCCRLLVAFIIIFVATFIVFLFGLGFRAFSFAFAFIGLLPLPRPRPRPCPRPRPLPLFLSASSASSCSRVNLSMSSASASSSRAACFIFLCTCPEMMRLGALGILDSIHPVWWWFIGAYNETWDKLIGPVEPMNWQDFSWTMPHGSPK